MPSALKTFLSTAALALLLLLAVTAPAAAKGGTPCWKQVINDWYDGRIDNTYPIPCYQEAIRHLPADVQTYASAADQIQRAMLDAIRHDRGDIELGHDKDRQIGPVAIGSGPGGGSGDDHKGIIQRLLDRLGPSNAESVPLPLLVLGSIALLLLAAASASVVARRIQARRMLPQPAPATAPQTGPER